MSHTYFKRLILIKQQSNSQAYELVVLDFAYIRNKQRVKEGHGTMLAFTATQSTVHIVNVYYQHLAALMCNISNVS